MTLKEFEFVFSPYMSVCLVDNFSCEEVWSGFWITCPPYFRLLEVADIFPLDGHILRIVVNCPHDVSDNDEG